MNKPLLRSNNINQTYLKWLVIILTLLCSHRVLAEDITNNQSTVSYGGLRSSIDDSHRAAIIEQNKTLLITDQIAGLASGKDRETIISEQTAQSPSASMAQSRSLNISLAANYQVEFNIYDATTILHNDSDHDGFYQSFSVIFDADVYGEIDIGNVYARLYLSKDGGPWIHYYTTDDFTIYNQSDQDAYEVITTFRDSYPPGYYDVLIDLYEVGYNGIVATYSADNNATLYALPLESSNNDAVYVSGITIRHGGSFSLLSLLILSIGLLMRLQKKSKKNAPS